jgi:hypothetical protein
MADERGVTRKVLDVPGFVATYDTVSGAGSAIDAEVK